MDNYWYYTLSAIPQTLAAIIALSATFVVFKLNFLSEKIKDSRTDLRRSILLLTSSKQTEIHDIEPLNDDEFLKLYEEGLSIIKPTEEELGLDPGIHKRLRDELSRIITDDWKSAFPPRQARVVGYLTMKRDIFKDLLKIRKKSLRLLFWSLLISALVITTSLILLPNYNYIDYPISAIWIILVFTVLSIILTTLSVWIIARS